MQRYLCSLVALGLLVGVTGRAIAQPSYTFSTLDVPAYDRPTWAPLSKNAIVVASRLGRLSNWELTARLRGAIVAASPRQRSLPLESEFR